MTTAKAGEVVTIELAATPSTGYQWRPVSPPSALEFLDSGFTPAGTSPGQGGTQWFRFQTREPGRFAVAFVLKREWEDDPIDAETVVVEVRAD